MVLASGRTWHRRMTAVPSICLFERTEVVDLIRIAELVSS
jgi:hypothetical protein